MGIFSGVVAEAKKIFDGIKSELVKAATAAPAVVATIEKDEPEVIALASLAFPHIAVLEPAANACLEGLAHLLETGGAAAEQNLLNAGIDSSVIAQAKSALPALKAVGAALKKAV